MIWTLIYLIAGALFISMALGSTLLQRLPLTTSVLYLGVGVVLGPIGFGLMRLDAVRDAHFLERASELAVIISLFTTGLKLRAPLRDNLWQLPLRLAFGSMLITIGGIAIASRFGLGLSWGASILLGAILAPTDPVLASDVQVEHPFDRDKLRFSLTGEAGLNDGTAFPFVLLGLGLLGVEHDFNLAHWLLVDTVLKVAGGLIIGAISGTAIGKLVLYLRREHQEATGLDDFLALGLIALSYGLGLALLQDIGAFLSVFAAGVALRRMERQQTPDDAGDNESQEIQATPFTEEETETDATHPEKAPAFLAQALLGFNEQLERMGEVGVVLLIGALLLARPLAIEAWWFVVLLFVVIRPLSVWIGLIGSRASRVQRRMVAWFGIRGIGSVFYLSYAVAHGLPRELAYRLTDLCLLTVAASIVVHGVSVTPLMNFYAHRFKNRRDAKPPSDA